VEVGPFNDIVQCRKCILADYHSFFRLQKQMLKEDKELGLHLDTAQEEEEEETKQHDVPDIASEQEEQTKQEDVLHVSDTESIEAAMAEFAINESTEEPSRRDAKVEEAGIHATQEEKDVDAGDASPEEKDEESAAKAKEPQMSKRDKRRAREARKKAELEAAADMPVKEVRQEHEHRDMMYVS
jgi:DnaJ family protein A protein 5